MDERTRYRLNDIADAIDQIDLLLRNLTFPDFVQDRVKRAACERFLEIISEASRHLPVEYKDQHPAIPWRRIADVGNHLGTPIIVLMPRFCGKFTAAANWSNSGPQPTRYRKNPESHWLYDGSTIHPSR